MCRSACQRLVYPSDFCWCSSTIQAIVIHWCTVVHRYTPCRHSDSSSNPAGVSDTSFINLKWLHLKSMWLCWGLLKSRPEYGLRQSLVLLSRTRMLNHQSLFTEVYPLSVSADLLYADGMLSCMSKRQRPKNWFSQSELLWAVQSLGLYKDTVSVMWEMPLECPPR